GLLVVIYGRYYLYRHDPMGNFFTYLLLFQGAMVGVVLSNNVLLLLVFWELTSLSSFLLIGFWGHTAAGRQGARMALTVTGLGGLSLIGGMLLLARIAGSYEVTEILASGDLIRQSELYPVVLGLILVGCFTKSAQFPFHFWLPHAMAAPTPVSAYLHSATMVKAGVFLLARFWPVLSGTDYWFYSVSTIGLITMLLGAVLALYKDDLKAILAYSTISHLGLMTMLLGFNSELAVVACVFHIINHATFKAALFMNAGIVDHEVGTRDMSRLGGLRHLMPGTAVIGTLAAVSMAGLPPMNGFLSKEMMLEEAAHSAWVGSSWLIPSVVIVAAVVSFAYSMRYAIYVYFGKGRRDYPKTPHDPKFGLWFSPLLLVILGLLIGMFPETIAGSLVRVASTSVIGHAQEKKFYLAIWHGWTPALWMSIAIVTVGSLWLLAYSLTRRVWNQLSVPDAKHLFDQAIEGMAWYAKAVTHGLHNGSLQRYVAMIIVTAVMVGGVVGWRNSGQSAPSDGEFLPIYWIGLVGFVLCIAPSLFIGLRQENRLVVLVVVSLLGLMTSLAFVYFSAPDLALTQISVEVVTFILMLQALYFLPKRGQDERPVRQRWGHVVLAVSAGLGAGGLSWLMMTSKPDNTLADYYWTTAVPGSGGHNVVNVILVDFRGFDTFGEIMVLGIAALIIFAILQGSIHGPLRPRLKSWRSGELYSPSRHPLMMVVVTRLMLPLALMVAVFILLRGHNYPGGGFIAALVVSIALVMQYMASGFGWAERQIRFDYHALIGSGALIAAATGIAAMVLGQPFLKSGFDHFHLPVVGKFELSSAMAFDLGVFLTVMGGVMLALSQFSKLGDLSRDKTNDDSPTDCQLASPDDSDMDGASKSSSSVRSSASPSSNPTSDQKSFFE
ncbi:MAG: monovalent cation/H+ antiporter subunit A, partial [Pirellulaceae bacterium]|nr:monovalent cation/H+ antiporter subunit A [Pirellulaceae bacterium]